MNLSAFLHLPYDNYAYLTAKNEVEIRLRTGIEVDGVVLHYNDPYVWNEAGWIAQCKTMTVWGGWGTTPLFCHSHPNPYPSRKVLF